MRTRHEIQLAARERQDARDKAYPRSVFGTKRPLGVVLISLLTGIAALVFLFVVPPPLNAASSEIASKAGYTFFVWSESVTGLIGAAGLLFLAEWARVMMIVRALATVTYQLLVNASQSVTGGVLFQVLLMIAVVVYLLQPEVRKAFAIKTLS